MKLRHRHIGNVVLRTYTRPFYCLSTHAPGQFSFAVAHGEHAPRLLGLACLTRAVQKIIMYIKYLNKGQRAMKNVTQHMFRGQLEALSNQHFFFIYYL